jgi:PKD repeat protein
MKYFLLIALSILASAQVGRSQCAPNNPTGNIGFFPPTDNLPCVERGVYYDETFYLENVDSFFFQGFGTLTVDTLIIDSIVNVPCNLQWITDRGSNTYYRAETGCIRIFGMTEDTVGQYELKVYVTLKTSLIGTLQGEINEIISDLQALTGNLGIDFEYFIRVNNGGACPNIDRSANAPSARTAKRNCAIAGEISVKIDGDTAFCRNDGGDLDLLLGNVNNPLVEWIPATAVTNANAYPTTVALNQSGYVTVSITDTANTGDTYIDRVWVTVDTAAPVALADTAITNGLNVKLTSRSLNGGTYLWNFGDQTTATGSVVLHSYATDGVYPISLTVTNNCGTDIYYDTLYIGNVGVADITKGKVQFNLYPNPAKGSVELSVIGLNAQDEYSIAILDLSGKSVVQPRTLQYVNNARVNVDIDALQSGIYIFQIKTLHSSTFHKLIIY